MFFQYGFQNLSLNLLLLFRWLQLLSVQPNISTSTSAQSLYIKSCTYFFFRFSFGWHFCPQILPNQSISISYLLVFNNCNYTLLILKCCPSLLDNTGIRVCPRHFRNSSLTCKILVFSLCFYCQPCVQRHDISRKPITSLKQILGSSHFFDQHV